MKSILTCVLGTLLVTLMKAQPVAGQYFPPQMEDYAALAAPTGGALQTGVLNTGTDMIQVESPNGVGQLQVSVWDNGSGQVVFSSAIQTIASAPAYKNAFTIALPTGYTSLSDPDVALAYYQGNLFADVVYLASRTTSLGVETQTFFDVYQWDVANQKFLNNPSPLVRQALGVAIVSASQFGGALNRSHSSPNIDANQSGRVGIVWQETSVETAKITVLSPSYSSTSSPPYPNGYSYIQEGLVFAESFVLPAYADGTLYLPCAGSFNWRGDLISKSTSYNPNPTLGQNNPPILFNQTTKPDVAVASDGAWWVSYLVSSANQVGPPVTTGLNLVLRKVTFDCGNNVPQIANTLLATSWSDGVTLNQPRLAASSDPNRPNDVEVVQAWAGGACVERVGSRSYYEIHNWGGSGGNFRESFTVVSQPKVVSENGYLATEPVVAFYWPDGGASEGRYVVAWTGSDYPEIGNSQDVWARTLQAGDLLYSGYSRVNNSDPLENPEGKQYAPSVAARFSGQKDAVAFLFADAESSTVRYRYSDIQAGSGELNRPAAPGAGNATGQQRTASPRSLEAFPNPSNQNVELRVSLRPGEVVQQLQITDLSGRVLDTVPLGATRSKASEATKGSAESTFATYTWQPRSGISAGTYMLKLVTNQRTERISVLRN